METRGKSFVQYVVSIRQPRVVSIKGNEKKAVSYEFNIVTSSRMCQLYSARLKGVNNLSCILLNIIEKGNIFVVGSVGSILHIYFG